MTEPFRLREAQWPRDLPSQQPGEAAAPNAAYPVYIAVPSRVRHTFRDGTGGPWRVCQPGWLPWPPAAVGIELVTIGAAT